MQIWTIPATPSETKFKSYPTDESKNLSIAVFFKCKSCPSHSPTLGPIFEGEKLATQKNPKKNLRPDCSPGKDLPGAISATSSWRSTGPWRSSNTTPARASRWRRTQAMTPSAIRAIGLTGSARFASPIARGRASEQADVKGRARSPWTPCGGNPLAMSSSKA